MLKQQINISWPASDLPFEEKPYDLTLTYTDVADPKNPIQLSQEFLKELSFETVLSLQEQISVVLGYKTHTEQSSPEES